MTILAVDNEKLMLERLCRCIKEAVPEAMVVSFKYPTDALSYMETHQVDVVFLEVLLRKTMGIELAKQMKQKNPQINIIFTTNYSDYIYEAMSEVRCSGFIVKPVTTELVRKELENLRNPVTKRGFC